MDTLYFPASSPRNLKFARRLARLDAAMRKPGINPRAAVRARVRFFVEAVRCGVESDCQLNALGDQVQRAGTDTQLSERSYNLVFEDGTISDAAVREIVRMADRDRSFETALIMTGHHSSLAKWRSYHRPEGVAA